MKRCRNQKQCWISILFLLCISIFAGCNFNISTNSVVDNSTKNTEIGDNDSKTELSDTENDTNSENFDDSEVLMEEA